MKTFIKQLFCKHQWVYGHETISPDDRFKRDNCKLVERVDCCWKCEKKRQIVYHVCI